MVIGFVTEERVLALFGDSHRIVQSMEVENSTERRNVKRPPSVVDHSEVIS